MSEPAPGRLHDSLDRGGALIFLSGLVPPADDIDPSFHHGTLHAICVRCTAETVVSCSCIHIVHAILPLSLASCSSPEFSCVFRLSVLRSLKSWGTPD